MYHIKKKYKSPIQSCLSSGNNYNISAQKENDSMEVRCLGKEVICALKKKRQTMWKPALLPKLVFFKGKKIRASETGDVFLKTWPSAWYEEWAWELYCSSQQPVLLASLWKLPKHTHIVTKESKELWTWVTRQKIYPLLLYPLNVFSCQAVHVK